MSNAILTPDNRIITLNGSISQTLRNAEVETVMSENPPEKFEFYFCEDHQKDLIAATSADKVQIASHTLFTVASRAMGTENLKRFHCPVCAFQKFDWILEIAEVVNGQ